MPETLELGEIPFYWRAKNTADQPPLDIPARLPFAFTFVPELQLVVQRRNDAMLTWLERVYRENANVGYLQEGHALAASYGGEFVEFFERASKLLQEAPASAADIGCGGVYLLQRVREKGLSVKGIDPSPVTAEAGRKAGIDIVADFYPSPSLTERFDVLFHYDVLEHVDDPVAFLKSHHANLSANGAIIFAVPDCTQHIRLGDASMILHEHLNFYDTESLDNVVRAAGFRPLILEVAKHGGVLLCCAVPDSSVAMKVGQKGWAKFDSMCESAAASFEAFVKAASLAAGKDLGLYIPLRAFPFLSHLPASLKLRFFDDDPGLHGRYYDGFDVPIENRDDLIANPPAHLIICSHAFGDQIASKLPTGVSVTKWSELFERKSG
ncbi:class I SAM-dependent methyltransferase [Hoeflea sp.]|uniref:class I SAM-dependent methyltransferase n=1 Tax=Hoeflea sp. TaxID=1940281 RepID=UPI003A8FDC04